MLPVIIVLINHLTSPLLVIIKRTQRTRLRRIMRGYRVLRQSGRLNRIAVVKQALTEHSLDLPRECFSTFVMGCGGASGEAVLKQYLLYRVGGINLNRALLLALGKKHGRVIFPMPRKWRKILTRHGFEVANFRSALLWQLYICAMLLYGIVVMVKTAASGISSRDVSNISDKKYAYFVALTMGNLPQNMNGTQSHDVISWYLQWSGRNPDIKAVRHSVPNSSLCHLGDIEVLPQADLFPTLKGWVVILKYICWGILASVLAVVGFMRGHWWHAFLLNEAALAAQVRFLPIDSLASEYLFHNSDWIYRPLWTHEAASRGSMSALYFYSTNCESFKKPEGYPSIAYGWKAMTWPRYLVWDEYQSDFVSRAVGKQAKIDVVGPIWFHSNASEMPVLDKLGIAVFDVTPHRQSHYCTLGLENEYYTPRVANPFLEDIFASIENMGLLMLWKRKRNIGRIAHPLYRYLVNQFANKPQVILVEAGISAIRVIESSVAVISMPFTSTALIARDMGKPSIYYDPSGLLELNDRAAHGIPIISGKNELNAWLFSLGAMADESIRSGMSIDLKSKRFPYEQINCS